jgi:glycine cleavage system regulatory protein
MLTPLVMTLIGPDRTGLVEQVARTIATHGGNWRESRLCRLGGEFAGILRLELPEANRTALLMALQAIPDLQVVGRPDAPKVSPPNAQQTQLEIIGSDRPGIVREISSALARAQVNVEEFSSEVVSAPMSGETLFKASARLQLPASCDLDALKKDLEKIAVDLLVDVSFSELSKSPALARIAPG